MRWWNAEDASFSINATVLGSKSAPDDEHEAAEPQAEAVEADTEVKVDAEMEVKADGEDHLLFRH